MSGYSLEILNREIYEDNFEDELIYNLENYFYHLNFRIGKGIEDIDELKHTRYMYKIMHIDNCEIINYISDKIRGTLPCEKKKSKSLAELMHKYKKHHGFGDTDIIVPHVYWSDAQW